MAGPSVSASFAYDGLGRRATKTINGQSTSFLYDGLDLVRESGASGDAAYLRTLAIDEALVRTDAADTVHFLADALGSTVALSDSTAATPTSYTYAPFGETTVSGATANLFQFTGRENDGTGLYYYQARYYDPIRSRFISEDPITVRFPWNKYAYVLNSPLGFTDPFGLKPLSYSEIKKLVAENNRSGVPDEVIIAQTWKESSFDPDATNPGSTARGLLQVTKPAAQDVGANHDDLFDPTLNIQAGTDYLRNRLDLVRKRRQDLTDEEARIRRGLELYKSGDARGIGYGDDILAAAKCLGGRKGNPKRCLEKIHK